MQIRPDPNLDPSPQKCPQQLHCKSLRLLNLDFEADLDKASQRFVLKLNNVNYLFWYFSHGKVKKKYQRQKLLSVLRLSGNERKLDMSSEIPASDL